MDINGVLELDGRGQGVLRNPAQNYAIKPDNAIVPADLCRSHVLRGGERISGKGLCDDRRGGRTVLQEIATINEMTPGEWGELPTGDKLIAIDPRSRIRFETEDGPTTMRIIDLMTPMGLGQRALIVAPPRTGKTVLLQQMAHGIATNLPDAYMMVLLIDERPEEVTEMRRTVHGEVVHSSNDESVASHTRIARLMIEAAKRRVECGEDVIILLDSLTRLGRAFNADIRGSGRIMSGGLDIRALIEPKSIFGAARNIENGGSLTIIASALIETGSRMDDVIFNEFKGTGNMEIVLSHVLANKRIWPAIDLQQSGTRKEELLLEEAELTVSHKIRREMIGRPVDMAMESLLERMGKHANNASFVAMEQKTGPRRR